MAKTAELDAIPPTEPASIPVVKQRKTARAPRQSATKLSGESLMPNLDATRAVTARRYWYWIGVLPTAPTDNIQITGINFAKAEEVVTKRGNKTHRHGVIGSLVQLDQGAILRLRERLPRTVVRVFPETTEVVSGTGMQLAEAYERKSKGQMITIPRKEDLDALRKQGLPAQPYVQHPNDQPGARYMFAQLCEDQERPQRGSYYPEVLEVTGLEWPDELQE
jgi:hypothetical protein